MTEDLLIKEVTSGYKRRMMYKIENSLPVDIEQMIDSALEKMLNFSLTVPEDGYFGTIGVMKEIPIRKSNLETFRPKIRKILNDDLMKIQSDKLIKTIGTTSALSLIKGVFENEGKDICYSYHDMHDKIVLRVEIDKTHYITLSVHFSSNMLSDVDRIMPAVKEAREMLEKYGADFCIGRN